VYSLDDFRKGLRNPALVYSELCKPLVHANTVYNRRLRGRSGIRVMERDWDNLVILDGCRYDTFERLNTIDGGLTAVVSGGSSSDEFVRHNFRGDTFYDTVYVSANPYVVREGVAGNFYDDLELWQTDWDEDLRTVRPETVADAALEAHERHPHKRLIVHFMQPHFPFIGEFGRTIDQRGILEDDSDSINVWEQLRHGRLDRPTVRRAYEENLELVLPHVERLVEGLNGTSAVTADHGNGFGRLGVHGHPTGVFLRCLVEVPWLRVPGESPRRIETADARLEESAASTTGIEGRLADLGYLDG
jgi:hypothetical protein